MPRDRLGNYTSAKREFRRRVEQEYAERFGKPLSSRQWKRVRKHYNTALKAYDPARGDFE